MRGPAGVRNAGAAFKMFGADLRLQFGHARRTARPLQAVHIHRHAAGVVAAVFKALQTLHEDGNNVAVRNRGDDTAHKPAPEIY